MIVGEYHEIEYGYRYRYQKGLVQRLLCFYFLSILEQREQVIARNGLNNRKLQS